MRYPHTHALPLVLASIGMWGDNPVMARARQCVRLTDPRALAAMRNGPAKGTSEHEANAARYRTQRLARKTAAREHRLRGNRARLALYHAHIRLSWQMHAADMRAPFLAAKWEANVTKGRPGFAPGTMCAFPRLCPFVTSPATVRS